MTCPNCGGKLIVIDPNWSLCHQLAKCDDCGEECAVPKPREYDWQRRKDLA